MRRVFVLVCTFCMFICGCSSHPENNDKDRLVLDFDGTHSMIVGSLDDRVISPSEEVELVNSVIEKYKDYKFKRIENRNDKVLYSLAWYNSAVSFETSYNIKFKYNEELFESAYNELFKNPSIESIQIIDDQTIIYDDQYYTCDKSMDLNVIKSILSLARNYKVSIFVPDEYFENLNEQEMTIIDLDEQSIIKELINVGVLPDFVKVNNVKIDNNSVYIDFNQDFTGFLVTMGAAGESMIIKSLVNSYIKTYDVKNVVITVNQQKLETPYTTYKDPITYME